MEKETTKTCLNCQKIKSGECGWMQKTICSDYQPVSHFIEQNKHFWPEYGDATYFRLKG